MMLDRILEKIHRNVKKVSPEYMQSVENRLKMFLNYTQLPPCFMRDYIDSDNAPPKLKKLCHDALDFIENNSSVLVNLATFRDGGFISAFCIEYYALLCILDDVHIPSILYIDTKMLIEDYKKLMDRNPDGLSPATTHSLDVLYKEIEEAEFVFWDKFSMMSSSYATSKLYDIINVRYRECLGNMFFITGGYDYFKTSTDIELQNVMNYRCSGVYDLATPLLDNKGKPLDSGNTTIKYVRGDS